MVRRWLWSEVTIVSGDDEFTYAKPLELNVSPLYPNVIGLELFGAVGKADLLVAFAPRNDAVVKAGAGSSSSQFMHFKAASSFVGDVKTLALSGRCQEDVILDVAVDRLCKDRLEGDDRPNRLPASPSRRPQTSFPESPRRTSPRCASCYLREPRPIWSRCSSNRH